jgi:putative transposase
MPGRPPLATGGLAYQLLNRRVGRLPLFKKPQDYAAFERSCRKPSSGRA